MIGNLSSMSQERVQTRGLGGGVYCVTKDPEEGEKDYVNGMVCR